MGDVYNRYDYLAEKRQALASGATICLGSSARRADRRCAWLSQARPPVYFGVCYRRAVRGGPAILKRGGAA
jgi:hypothetical protein